MFSDLILKHTFFALVIIVGSAIAGQVLRGLFEVFLRKLIQKTESTLDDRIIPVIGSYVSPLSLIIGLSIGVREIRKGLTAEHVTHNQILDYFSVIVFVVYVIILTRLVSRLVKAVLEWYIEDLAVKTHRSETALVAPLLMKFVNVLLLFIAVLIVLDHMGINVGSLLVSLGVGSLAIALAAQETLSNMIGWFVILLDQPFRVGDHIKLPSGEEGKVYQIGLRATRILNADNNLAIIPNGDIVKSRIVNVFLPDSATRLVIEVPVSYSTDMERVRRCVVRLLEQQPDIHRDPPPEVVPVGFGDSGFIVRISARVEFSRRWAVETSLREQIMRTFKKDGIVISVPQRVIHIVNPDGPQAAQAH
jgi:MscS family membrane protein